MSHIVSDRLLSGLIRTATLTAHEVDLSLPLPLPLPVRLESRDISQPPLNAHTRSDDDARVRITGCGCAFVGVVCGLICFRWFLLFCFVFRPTVICSFGLLTRASIDRPLRCPTDKPAGGTRKKRQQKEQQGRKERERGDGRAVVEEKGTGY